jgi:hypothetical protein
MSSQSTSAYPSGFTILGTTINARPEPKNFSKASQVLERTVKPTINIAISSDSQRGFRAVFWQREIKAIRRQHISHLRPLFVP